MIRLRTQRELIETAWERYGRDHLGFDDMSDDEINWKQARFAEIRKTDPVFIQAAQVTALFGIWDIVLYRCDQCSKSVTEIYEFDVVLHQPMVHRAEGRHRVCRECLETALADNGSKERVP